MMSNCKECQYNMEVCMNIDEAVEVQNNIVCIGRIRSVSKNMYISTMTESGRIYLVLENLDRATLWEFRIESAQRLPIGISSFNVMDNTSKQYLTFVIDGDNRDAVLEPLQQTANFRWLITRSGYNPSDIDNLLFTNEGVLLNLNVTGGTGSKLQLKTPKGNDNDQKFVFEIDGTNCYLDDDGLDCDD